MKTITFYEIQSGKSGGFLGKDGTYNWSTIEEAVKIASEFKANPRSHNKEMTDENVKYWKSKDYIVTKKIISTEEITTI